MNALAVPILFPLSSAKTDRLKRSDPVGGTDASQDALKSMDKGELNNTVFQDPALIIDVLNNILDLTNVSAYWQQIIKGCIIVGAVILDQLKQRGRR